MQKEFIVEWEDDLDKFSCEIGDVCYCSPFLEDILDDIAKRFDYVYKEKYSESHYKATLEADLGIVIHLNFDW